MAKTRTGVSIASVGKALSRALALLSRRAYTEAELREKLAEYPEAEVEAALVRLRVWGYLDDRKLAEAFVRRRAGRYGPYRLARDLRARGVPEDLVEELVSDLAEEEAAVSLLSRRWSRYRGNRARAVRFLLGRGFSLEAALSAFDRLRREEAPG